MFIKREDAKTMLEAAQIITNGEYCGYCTEDIDVDAIPSVSDNPKNIHDTKQLLSSLLVAAELLNELALITEKLKENEFFDNLLYWLLNRVYYNCEIINNKLYTDRGFLLSDNNCMDKKIPYFITKTPIHYKNSYRGSIFIKVNNDNTFVEVLYESRGQCL